MYAKIKSNQIIKFPYGFADLQQDNPYTNYGDNTDLLTIFPATEEALLRGCELVEVTVAECPEYNTITHRAELEPPILTNGTWVQQWKVIAKTVEEALEQENQKAKEVREERNILLTQSDWTQVLDAKVDRNSWAVYRQLLRDITKQPEFPFGITWPPKPEE